MQSFDRLRVRGKRLRMKVLVDEDRLEDYIAQGWPAPRTSGAGIRCCTHYYSPGAAVIVSGGAAR